MRKSLAAFAVLGLVAGLPMRASGESPGPDAIFARAKDAWRVRNEVPFVRYGLLERYTWRGRTHDNWWRGSYRNGDRGLALNRIILPDDESARLRGMPITINLRLHHGDAHADSFDTNPDADAFPILDPQIAPNASFGLMRLDPKISLVGAPGDTTPAPAASPLPTPVLQPSAPVPNETPLREIVRVEAVARDYRIELAGTERVRDADTYHLTLTPLRHPNVNRLRDLWVDVDSYATVQLALAGLFDGEPYANARWLVTYVKVDGRYYIGQVKTDEQLKFGADRYVDGLEYDFVQYEFPPSIPEMTFQRYL
jgi:hypothetical protein